MESVKFDFGEGRNGNQLGIRLPPDESEKVRKVMRAEGKTAIGVVRGFVNLGFSLWEKQNGGDGKIPPENPTSDYPNSSPGAAQPASPPEEEKGKIPAPAGSSGAGRPSPAMPRMQSKQ